MSLQARRLGLAPGMHPKNEHGKATVHGVAYGTFDRTEIDKKLYEMLAVLLRFQGGIKKAKLEETLHMKATMLGKLAEAMKQVDDLAVQAYELAWRRCFYCGDPAQGNFSINRDGIDVGPLLDFCNGCGSSASPTMEMIWDRLRNKTKLSPVDDKFMRRLDYSMKIISELLKGLEP